MFLVVFDMDGTLNQTDAYAVEAYQNTLRDMNAGAYTREQIIARFGAPFSEDFTYFFGKPDEETRQQFMKILGNYWDRLLEEKARAYEGVLELLENLKKEGCLLAVCSNAEEKDIHVIGEHIGVLPYIDYVQPLVSGETKADSLKRLIFRVKPEGACMVGDRWYDREAAKEAGVPFIGCAYGYAPDEVSGAYAVVQKPAEILEAVKRLMN